MQLIFDQLSTKCQFYIVVLQRKFASVKFATCELNVSYYDAQLRNYPLSIILMPTYRVNVRKLVKLWYL